MVLSGDWGLAVYQGYVLAFDFVVGGLGKLGLEFLSVESVELEDIVEIIDSDMDEGFGKLRLDPGSTRSVSLEEVAEVGGRAFDVTEEGFGKLGLTFDVFVSSVAKACVLGAIWSRIHGTETRSYWRSCRRNNGLYWRFHCRNTCVKASARTR